MRKHCVSLRVVALALITLAFLAASPQASLADQGKEITATFVLRKGGTVWELCSLIPGDLKRCVTETVARNGIKNPEAIPAGTELWARIVAENVMAASEHLSAVNEAEATIAQQAEEIRTLKEQVTALEDLRPKKVAISVLENKTEEKGPVPLTPDTDPWTMPDDMSEIVDWFLSKAEENFVSWFFLIVLVGLALRWIMGFFRWLGFGKKPAHEEAPLAKQLQWSQANEASTRRDLIMTRDQVEDYAKQVANLHEVRDNLLRENTKLTEEVKELNDRLAGSVRKIEELETRNMALFRRNETLERSQSRLMGEVADIQRYLENRRVATPGNGAGDTTAHPPQAGNTNEMDANTTIVRSPGGILLLRASIAPEFQVDGTRGDYVIHFPLSFMDGSPMVSLFWRREKVAYVPHLIERECLEHVGELEALIQSNPATRAAKLNRVALTALLTTARENKGRRNARTATLFEPRLPSKDMVVEALKSQLAETKANVLARSETATASA